MRLPQRRSQMMVKHGPESDHLTPEALERLKNTLHTLEKIDRPKIVVDLSHALTLGDFSENAEYQDAKARLSRIDGRIFGLKERIKNAIVIKRNGSADSIQLGSTVKFNLAGKEKTYEILGPQEANPTRGKISYLSPLGAALIGKKAGEKFGYASPDGATNLIEILEVK
ncbi:transcription elongation factor GreA [Patescibacteria group bacterium]|nr:transcription elongation factor GreA [Patescibacteria group bacterium]